MEFSIRLKEMREAKQISQAELAKIIGVGISTVGMWESTNRVPGAKTLQRLISYFGCSIDYLLGQTEDPNAIVVKDYSLKTREQQLIENYRKLPSQTQDYVFGIVQNLALNS